MLEHMDNMNFPGYETVLKEALEGVTFVSLVDAMKMKMNDEQCSKLPFIPSWPMSLVPCQLSVSNYGYKPSMVPPF